MSNPNAYGAYGPPGTYYPPPSNAYDFYGQYPNPPPPPPNSYGYPPSVFFFCIFLFSFLVTYILEATHVILSPICNFIYSYAFYSLLTF
jgi:hypothetical protein